MPSACRSILLLNLLFSGVAAAHAGIQLSAFTATVPSPSRVDLAWTTLTETNNLGFNVQKSLDTPTDFQTVPGSFVPGNGTTVVPHDYSYADLTASPGTWHYRLQQIDNDGSLHYTASLLVHVPFFGEYRTDSATGLLLHLDETAGTIAHDVSGNGNHGMVAGAVSAVGRFGSARSFSVAGDLIRIAAAPSLHPGTGTAEAWVIAPSIAGMANGVVMGKRNGPSSVSMTMRLSGTTGRMAFLAGPSPDSVVSTTVLQNDRWYHVASTFDGSQIRLYVNGVLEASRSLPGPISWSADGLFVGGDSGGTGTWLGRIDEVRISSSLRSPEEFALQLPPVGPGASLNGNTVHLEWGNGGGGVGLLRYRILRGTDSTTLVQVDSTVQTRYDDPAAPPLSTLYYRMVAVDSTGFAGRESPLVSITTPPAPPELLWPPDGASHVAPASIMVWQPAAGAAGYRLQMAPDSLFTAPVIDDSTLTDTMRTTGTLSPGSRWFWRVASRGATLHGGFGTPRSFSVLTLPAAALPLAPPSGAIVPVPSTTLMWQAGSPAVDRYQVDTASDSLFTVPSSDSTIVDTTAAVTGLVHDQRVWWRVRAHNAAGWGLFSNPRSFTAQYTVPVTLAQGWNMVALPVRRDDDSVRQVFPSCLTQYAFGFDGAAGYVQRFRLETGTGYWAKFPAATLEAVAGFPVTADSIPVSPGWNMIGSVSVPVDTADVETVPDGILTSLFFTYDNGNVPVAVLTPGRAHWIKSATTGMIILRQTP